MSMIRYKGSKDGVTLAAEVNLAQFNIDEYGKEKDILYDRLEDTSIPVNSVYVTPHTAEGYIDVVYMSDKTPIDACIEYVRPLGMYVFQQSGVRFDGRSKLLIDVRLTNTEDLGISIGPTHVGHYSRKDYASMQKHGSLAPGYEYTRENVWYRNPDYEVDYTGNKSSDWIDPGYRTLYSLQLCNNDHIVRSILPGQSDNDKIFGLGFAFQVLCICCCIAQTRESDKYYQRGIDNVETGQYKDAIEAFKKCKQIDGNTISQDFNISDNSHEWLGFCYYKSNDVDNAKQYSDFYKYKPYNRLLISGIDTLYNKVIIFFKDGKYDRALDYLNQIEDILSLKFGKNNIYLNQIWEQQASMHLGLNHYMAATNILTKIWNIYNDSIGPCYEWQKIGQKLIRCYSAEGKRDKAIQAEALDSNTVKICRTKTHETGLYLMKDSITPILLLPMEYSNIEKINDRFLFVTKDVYHHFIIDFSNWTFSKNITESSVFKYITNVDGVPVFSSFDKFVDFTGKTKKNKYSFYVGTEGDLIKFELDSVFYTIPKDSIMLSNNKVKYIFPYSPSPITCKYL